MRANCTGAPTLPGVLAARTAALTRREQWSEGILPSTRAGRPRSQGLCKSLSCEEIEGAVYAFPGFFQLQEVGCFGHEVVVQRHHIA